MSKKRFRLKELGNTVVIIDEEGSILARLIRDNFIHYLRKRKTNFDIYSLTREEADFLIDEYHLTEFPSVLYFKNKKLINRINGFSYFEQRIEEVA